MGSGSSKQKAAVAQQLQDAEQKYNSAVQKIVDRENELANKGKELRDLKSEAAKSSTQNSQLQHRIEELEARCSTLLQDREREVRKLQDELTQELSGQLRVAESLTQERNRARKEADMLREKNKSLKITHEDHVKALEQDFESKTKTREQAHADDLLKLEETNKNANAALQQERLELRHALEETTVELQTAKSEVIQLRERVQSLELSGQTLNDDLSNFKASLSNEQLEHANVIEALALTQRQLVESQAARDSIERLRNEAVSRRSATHEAFQATKLVLSESHESYRKLQEAHNKLEAQLSAVQKDASQSNDKHIALQQAHDKLAEELQSLRSNGEEPRSRLQMVQQDLTDLQHRHEEAQQANTKMAQDVAAARNEAEASRTAHQKLQSDYELEIVRLQKALADQQTTQGKLANGHVSALGASLNGLDQVHQKPVNGSLTNGHIVADGSAEHAITVV